MPCAAGRRSSAMRTAVRILHAFSARLNQDLDMFDGHFHVERVDAAAGQDDWLMAWRAECPQQWCRCARGAGAERQRWLPAVEYFLPLDLSRPKFAAAFTLLPTPDGLVWICARTGEATMQVPTCCAHAAGREDRRGAAAGPAWPAHAGTAAACQPACVPEAAGGADRPAYRSAAEFVAYSLQALGRARIVGTRSGGAAHMFGDPVLLPDGYQISISRPATDQSAHRAATGRHSVRPDVAGGDDPLFIARQLLAPESRQDERTMHGCPIADARMHARIEASRSSRALRVNGLNEDSVDRSSGASARDLRCVAAGPPRSVGLDRSPFANHTRFMQKSPIARRSRVRCRAWTRSSIPRPCMLRMSAWCRTR